MRLRPVLQWLRSIHLDYLRVSDALVLAPTTMHVHLFRCGMVYAIVMFHATNSVMMDLSYAIDGNLPLEFLRIYTTSEIRENELFFHFRSIKDMLYLGRGVRGLDSRDRTLVLAPFTRFREVSRDLAPPTPALLGDRSL